MTNILSQIKPLPLRCSWELTLKCNLRCKHCGSSAGEGLANELTTNEALDVADQLSQIGCEEVTLLGGEPFLRHDWQKIVRRLVNNGIETTFVTNGTLLNKNTIQQLGKLGVKSIGISIDGLKKTHNQLRGGNNAFQKTMWAIESTIKAGVSVCAVTVVLPVNFNELKKLAKELESIGVKSWQLQLPIPKGRYDEHEWLSAETAKKVVNFIAGIQLRSRLRIYAGCNVGYLGVHEELVRAKDSNGLKFWTGCYAGILLVSIRSNGDVTGCLTMPSELTAGNLKNKTLTEIWENDDAFFYNRAFSPTSLSGGCAACGQSDICRGGCRTMSYYLTGALYNDPCCELRVRKK